MKILHYSDQHLKDSMIEEARKCLDFIRDTAAKEQVDLIVSAGDWFDSRDVRLESPSAKLAIEHICEMADIAPVAIITGTNSHDGNAPMILSYARGRFPVIVADKPMQVLLDGGKFLSQKARHEYLEAVITLIPQPTKQFFQTESGIKTADQEIGAAMSQIFAGFGAMAAEYDAPHILVYHGGISGARISNGQTLTGQDIEVSIAQLSLSGANVHCCGHIHLPQIMPDRTFYAGSIYAKDWGENHVHGFYIYEIDGQNLLYYFNETPTRKLIRIADDFTINSPDDIPLNVYLTNLDGSERDIEGAFVRCDFSCWQDEAGMIDKEMIKQSLMDAGAIDVDIRLVRKPRETVRSEAVLKVERLRDKLVAMAALKDETVPESILEKADLLEGEDPEKLIASLLQEKVEVAG